MSYPPPVAPVTGQPFPSAPAPRRRTGLVLVVIAAVTAVVLVAAGGFVAWRVLLASGPRPAEVLPASTFGMVSVDLDPATGQKIEAVRTLRGFPAVREDGRLTEDTDPVESVVEELLEQGRCGGVDYDRDVAPWIGKRAAFGGVLLPGRKPAPVFALQVTDADAARDGFGALADCAQEEARLGWAVVGDYVVASDTRAHARAIVAAAEEAPLADDAAYQRWTEEAGGDGVVNLYVAPAAADVIGDSLDGGFLGDLGAPGTAGGEDQQRLRTSLDAFRGAAASLRFADHGIELAFAGGGGPAAKQPRVGDDVATLPRDTTALLALAVSEQSVRDLADTLGPQLGELSRSTGLDLPEDLVTLLGSSISLSVGGDAPTGGLGSPADLPLGALVHGDADDLRDLLARVEAKAGEELPVEVVDRDGKVALASSREYAEELVGSGTLADSETFRDVVPHAEESSAVVYVSLGEKWIDLLRDEARRGDDDDVELVDNLAAVRAFGASVWTEGSTTHGLVRLSVK